MSITKPGLICPVDGISPITLTPVVVGDATQTIQWQCTTDVTHNGIINAGGSGQKGSQYKLSGPISDALSNFFSKQPDQFSKSFQLDDGGIYVQRLLAPMIANLGPPSGQTAGFNTAVPIAAGFAAALGLVPGVKPPSSGQNIKPIVGNMIVDFYQVYTDQINNYAFSEPASLLSSMDASPTVQVGGSPLPAISNALRLGKRGPYLDPNGGGIAMPRNTLRNFPIAPSYGGLRFGAHYTPKGNDPGYDTSHWIQVIGSTSRQNLVETNGDAAVTTVADSLGLYWSMDNAGDPLDPFYDTPHPLGAPPPSQTHATATPQWFIDTPTASSELPPALNIYGLFTGCWLDQNFAPTSLPTTFDSPTGPLRYLIFSLGARSTDDCSVSTVPPTQSQLAQTVTCTDGIVRPLIVLFPPQLPGSASTGSLLNAAIAADASTLKPTPSDSGYISQQGWLPFHGTETITPIQISQLGYVYEYLTFQTVRDNPQLRLALAVPGLAAKAGVPVVLDVWTPR